MNSRELICGSRSDVSEAVCDCYTIMGMAIRGSGAFTVKDKR